MERRIMMQEKPYFEKMKTKLNAFVRWARSPLKWLAKYAVIWQASAVKTVETGLSVMNLSESNGNTPVESSTETLQYKPRKRERNQRSTRRRF